MERDPADLIEAYFSGELDGAGGHELRTWLRENPQRFEQLATQSRLETALNQVYQARQLQGVFDTTGVFDELLQAEEQAEPDFSLLHDPAFEQSLKDSNKAQITSRELLSLAGYLTARGLRTKVGVIGSVAAVLLLGLMLVIALVGQDNTPGIPETAGNTPDDSETNPARIVATLIDERGAVWGHQPGDNLYAGQRLVLNRGFAEIRTLSGAVTILEAPTTVEFIDDANAIRLHSGQLVGICETESSKGFTIHAPHMSLIDLGTRFDIEVDASGSGRISVSEGEVRVDLVDAPGSNRSFLLKESQSTTFERSAAGGKARIPFEINLHDTGRGLQVGDRDPFWTVNTSSDNDLPVPAMVSTLESKWAQPGQDSLWLQPGQDTFWLSMPSEDGVLYKQGRYPKTLVFEQAFNLPQDIDPASVRLAFRYIVDDSLTVLLNGQPVTGHLVSDLRVLDPQRWLKFTEVTLDKGFKPGRNVISVQAMNHDTMTAIGLRAEFGTLSGEREIKIGPGVAAAGIGYEEQ